MLISRRFYLVQPYQAQCYWGFKEYLDEETEHLIWMLKDFAAQKWIAFQEQMEGASDEEVGVEMFRWRRRQIRRFRDRLRFERRLTLYRRHLRRERVSRIQAADQLEATQEELHKVQRDLAVEREARAQLEAQWRCRECNADRWYRP